MIEIRSLKNVSMDLLYQAFSDAFADYEMQLSQQELARMLKRRGFDPDLSFGAFDGKRLVAFTFNGIGTYRGIPTAYDTGTGTGKAYRGQGLARQIFMQSLPHLSKAGIRQYLLEVLQHNEKAVNLYLNLGFEVTREFYYFIEKIDRLKLNFRKENSAYQWKQVDLSELSEVDYSDFVSSWQNGSQSIQRGGGDFKALAVFLHSEIIAYCIYEPGSGDIASLAVAKQHRRKGIGSGLLHHALQNMESDQVKVINIPLEAEAAVGFLTSCQLLPSGKQFEMIRAL